MSRSRTSGEPFGVCIGVGLCLGIACSNTHKPSSSNVTDTTTTTTPQTATAASTTASTAATGGSAGSAAQVGGNSSGGGITQGATKSAGCSLTGKPTGDLHLSIKDGRGTARDIEVLVPTPYNPNTALSVVFAFHGLDGSQEDAKAFGLQSVPGAASSALFVFPQGVQYKTWGVGWDDSCGGYDVALFDNVLARLEADYCVDSSRIFISGFSWGCDFSTALLCCRGDRIRGVGAASCSDGFRNTSDFTTYQNYPCPASSHAAIRFTHDVTDDGAYTAAHFAVTSKLYQSLEGCSGGSSSVAPSPCVQFQNCAHSFVECAYKNLGHALPADWAAETWKFFTSTN